MWKLRREQLRVLEGAARRAFEERLAAHLRTYFPGQCQALGEAGVREAIVYGVGRAARWGFTGEREVCKYLNLMFTFGRDFDTDPALPWAAWNLGLGSPPSQRMARLYQAALAREARGRGFLAGRESRDE